MLCVTCFKGTKIIYFETRSLKNFVISIEKSPQKQTLFVEDKALRTAQAYSVITMRSQMFPTIWYHILMILQVLELELLTQFHLTLECSQLITIIIFWFKYHWNTFAFPVHTKMVLVDSVIHRLPPLTNRETPPETHKCTIHWKTSYDSVVHKPQLPIL
jgi:hypothetical protein